MEAVGDGQAGDGGQVRRGGSSGLHAQGVALAKAQLVTRRLGKQVGARRVHAIRVNSGQASGSGFPFTVDNAWAAAAASVAAAAATRANAKNSTHRRLVGTRPDVALKGLRVHKRRIAGDAHDARDGGPEAKHSFPVAAIVASGAQERGRGGRRESSSRQRTSRCGQRAVGSGTGLSGR